MIYDVSGNPLASDGGEFDVTDYSVYVDGDGDRARQGILTYNGNKLYPKIYKDQTLSKPKIYNGGVLLALGDSYTSMGSSQFSAFAEAHGLVVDNQGVVSSTIAGSADGSTVGFRAFWKRLDDDIASYPKTISGNTYALSDVKLVTFMGGANDWYTVDQTVDRIGNAESTNKEQLWGACKYIFQTLYTTFPNADIVVILQPSNMKPNQEVYAMWLKEGVVKSAAEMYSLPICDCCFDWHSPANPTDLSRYWQSDKLHLTSAGYVDLFDKLENTINNLPFYRAE